MSATFTIPTMKSSRPGTVAERQGALPGKRCQVWRHPLIDISEPALSTERMGQ